MRYTQYTLAATLVAGAAAAGGHQHGHQQFHARHVAHVEERDAPDAVTAWVAGPTETVYVLDGELIEADEAKDRIDGGELTIVGESTPTFVPPPPPAKPTTTAEAPELGAQFIEKVTTSSEVPEPEPETTTSSAVPTTSAAPQKSSTPKPVTGGGVDTPFPDGEIKCSHFPSDYGAVSLDWLGFNGWAGLQQVPDYVLGSLKSIVDIHTGISGDDCESGTMCSYACPPGYQKSQFPEAQGSTLESIGGLYCDSEGMLRLTHDPNGDGEYPLCTKGEGGVFIQNDLDEVVSTCRTDYPGTEGMYIPAIAGPGDKVELCNPDQSYYTWDNKGTSAQYYVNPKGFDKEEACIWKSDKFPDKLGNWAPVIAGVGYTDDGNTFLSIFQNAPMSTAKLDFNIEIVGDVNSKCSYIDGKWTGGSNGCTTAFKKGGKATFRYF
ncbi:uncharacterized protein J7T54_007577 [Emericellopsis cladophorae]|uniref:Murein transglycosylase n=1 Tax=Emericellopsis cladophorae TaxID=2686198 RepID=A0A9Q0BBB2_9HYPO|nr:uncharacterized protein J7T54_007577 [Emericellopsis cladophorae]KAI6779122.1 hypothetical protein J7T54_007577 [Emericellopsis cladophorae]